MDRKFPAVLTGVLGQNQRWERPGGPGRPALVWPVLGWFFLTGLSATAQQLHGRPEVGELVHHDVSPPLRDIPPHLARDGQRVIPLRSIPRAANQGQTDPVVQSTVGLFVATTSGVNVDGLGQGVYGFTVRAAPPDTNGAAGATQYVQFVNLSFAVFDKQTGALLYGPAAGSTLWNGVTNSTCGVTNDGDPIVRYDRLAGRWVMTQLSFSLGPPYYECLAISATSDATGAYYRYALQWTSNTLPDYPKLGVWPDAYYMSFNMFASIFFLGGEACALDRAKILLNQDATVQCFLETFSFPSLLPADLDGATLPPGGAPNYFMNLGSNSLNLFKFHVDFANPNNTTFTGPANLPVAKFNEACGGGTCIPQPGTSQQLDYLGDRLMYRLAYRNFLDHESLVVNHSVAPAGGKRGATSATAASGLRWYEIRNPNGTPTVFQQGTYAPDANSRWMGSIAMDRVGDIAVGYSVSSSSLHPSIRYTGRTPADPLGTLQAEATIILGNGSQLPNLNRWGDYSSMSLDPVDDCTFWYTTEYLKTDGKFNWNTRIASFKFLGCH